MIMKKRVSSLCTLAVTSILMALPLPAIAEYKCRNDIIATTPNSRFKIMSNGSEVKDIKTNLIWQRCSIGQTWDGNQCVGEATAMNWKDAMNEAIKAGRNYRVPNIKELQSITEVACFDPALNISIFPNTPTGVFDVTYWSSTPDLKNEQYIYIMRIEYGLINILQKDTDGHGTRYDASRGYVRLVRQ